MSEELGALVRAFEGDLAHERGVAWLRLVAAILASSAAAATLIGALPLPAFLVALTGLLVSMFWFRSASRTLAMKADRKPPRLEVHARGLRLTDEKGSVIVLFHDVTGIEVDDERLDVVVGRVGQPALRIEPRYPGISIEQLASALREAAGLGTRG